MTTPLMDFIQNIDEPLDFLGRTPKGV